VDIYRRGVQYLAEMETQIIYKTNKKGGVKMVVYPNKFSLSLTFQEFQGIKDTNIKNKALKLLGKKICEYHYIIKVGRIYQNGHKKAHNIREKKSYYQLSTLL
jgi:hypothetical protein